MAAQLFTTRPENFYDPLEVVVCFCEWEDKILLLKRHPEDLHGGTWGAPGGGVEPGEKPVAAAARELLEEAGILVEAANLKPLGITYIKLPDLSYTLYLFHIQFDNKPEVAVSLDENTEAKWTTIDEALQLDLMPAGKEALAHYRSKSKGPSLL